MIEMSKKNKSYVTHLFFKGSRRLQHVSQVSFNGLNVLSEVIFGLEPLQLLRPLEFDKYCSAHHGHKSIKCNDKEKPKIMLRILDYET